jgi:tetratricopeptide (TPR) repeat protein
MANCQGPSDDNASWHSTKKALPYSPDERKVPDNFFDYIDYTAEWPPRSHVNPVRTEVRHKLAQIRDDIQKMRNRRNEVVQKVTSKWIPPPRPDLIKRLKMFEASQLLINVINLLVALKFDLAMKEAKKALEIAQKLEDKVTIARCYYWMGRIEFKRENFPEAYICFKNALPCVEDNKCAEGDFVKFWFDISRSGISEQYRKRALDNHNRFLIDRFGQLTPPTHSSLTLSEKRKYKEAYEIIFRPRPIQQSHGQQGQTESSKQKNRLVPWIIPDIDDEPQDDTPVHCRQRFHRLAETESRQAQSHPPLGRHAFIFRCYPKGLSPRIRPTKIFRPHPFEIIHTARSWEELCQRATGKSITMSWLANERQLYANMIYKRFREGRRQYLESSGKPHAF